jgi:formylglycine-generating enzyme required for sulfatase activity
VVASSQSHNPYVGPRPFEREEQNLFFGREREISELQSLLTAHRTLLLYAASGAGKTSLLNAGLLPLMEKEGFEVLPVARVSGLIPRGVRSEDISNLYVFNTLMSWTEDEASYKALAPMALTEFLKAREHILDSEGFSAPRLIIFDQFEELFTIYQQFWKQREDFFHQVAKAIEEDPVLRVLFVIREDYLARLDPYVSLLPERLRGRYRLVRLRFKDACRAVEGPLHGSGKSFADGVAERLVGELIKTKVQSVIGETEEAVGEYVEPVQLQIVCRNLWDSLPAGVNSITSEHLRSFGDVDEALKGFYENAVQKTISEANIKEEELRKWFARELITPAGTRGFVYRGKEDTVGIPNAAIDILENEHILRGDLRAGAHWYELNHDRLIEPIRNSNEIWLTAFEFEQARLRVRKKLRKYLFVFVPVVLSILVALTIFSFKKKKETEQARDLVRNVAPKLFESTSTNSIGMKFVLIPAGKFVMGSQLSPEEVVRRYGGEAKWYKDEQPSHPVKITKPFYLQTTEVSQGQWEKVMGDNPSRFKDCGNDCPVEQVSWNDVQKFISKLNKMEGINKYRLPTEAEWEYACRAETTTPFFTGECISTDQANYNGNNPGNNCPKGQFREKTVKVGSFQPNAWGLYDMHGNVYEWVQDWYGDYPSNSVVDPKGPKKGEDRVLRGGSWYYNARNLRSANRLRDYPVFRYYNYGFRVARDF